MAKTFRWDDNQDPRKTTQKAKQDQKVQGRKEKQFLRSSSQVSWSVTE